MPFDVPLDVFRLIASTWLQGNPRPSWLTVTGFFSFLWNQHPSGSGRLVLCTLRPRLHHLGRVKSDAVSRKGVGMAVGTVEFQPCCRRTTVLQSKTSIVGCVSQASHRRQLTSPPAIQNSGLNRASLGFLLSLIGLRVLWEGAPDDVSSPHTTWTARLLFHCHCRSLFMARPSC